MAGIIQISNVHLRLDRKIISDRGNSTSLSSGGKTVSFTKTFVDIVNIKVNANSTSPRIAVYDFDGSVPNPTSFDVYIFNESGSQVACDFSWEASGI